MGTEWLLILFICSGITFIGLGLIAWHQERKMQQFMKDVGKHWYKA